MKKAWPGAVMMCSWQRKSLNHLNSRWRCVYHISWRSVNQIGWFLSNQVEVCLSYVSFTHLLPSTLEQSSRLSPRYSFICMIPNNCRFNIMIYDIPVCKNWLPVFQHMCSLFRCLYSPELTMSTLWTVIIEHSWSPMLSPSWPPCCPLFPSKLSMQYILKQAKMELGPTTRRQTYLWTLVLLPMWTSPHQGQFYPPNGKSELLNERSTAYMK